MTWSQGTVYISPRLERERERELWDPGPVGSLGLCYSELQLSAIKKYTHTFSENHFCSYTINIYHARTEREGTKERTAREQTRSKRRRWEKREYQVRYWSFTSLNITQVISDSTQLRSAFYTPRAHSKWGSTLLSGCLGCRVVSVLHSGAEGPGFKSQPRRCRVTVLGKLFTPIVPLFTKQQNW